MADRKNRPTDDDVIAELRALNRRLAELDDVEHERRAELPTVPDRPRAVGTAALAAGVLLFLAVALPTACASWSAPPAVSVAGSVTDRATPALIAAEEAMAFAVIDAGGNPDALMKRWDIFWAAWRIWTAAQRAWAYAYEARASGLVQLEQAARGAFCEAERALPPEVPKLVIEGTGIVCLLLPFVDAGAVDGGR